MQLSQIQSVYLLHIVLCSENWQPRETPRGVCMKIQMENKRYELDFALRRINMLLLSVGP